jgi:ribosomal protein S6
MTNTIKRMRNYQAVFILDSRGYDAPIETLHEMLREVIQKNGGQPGQVTSQGRKDFVRVTDKEHTGDFYLEIPFTGEPGVPAAIQEALRLEGKVKRILIEVRD